MAQVAKTAAPCFIRGLTSQANRLQRRVLRFPHRTSCKSRLLDVCWYLGWYAALQGQSFSYEISLFLPKISLKWQRISLLFRSTLLSSKANGYCTKREVLVCDFGVLFSHSLYFSPLSRTVTQRPVL